MCGHLASKQPEGREPLSRAPRLLRDTAQKHAPDSGNPGHSGSPTPRWSVQSQSNCLKSPGMRAGLGVPGLEQGPVCGSQRWLPSPERQDHQHLPPVATALRWPQRMHLPSVGSPAGRALLAVGKDGCATCLARAPAQALSGQAALPSSWWSVLEAQPQVMPRLFSMPPLAWWKPRVGRAF